jgi:hypothetical protein
MLKKYKKMTHQVKEKRKRNTQAGFYLAPIRPKENISTLL